jgi:Zn-dependent protease with chaperone function
VIALFGYFVIAALLSWFLNWLALIPWRRAAGQHWTERARRLYPARVSGQLNAWLIAVCLALFSCLHAPGPSFLAIYFAGFLGALLGSYPMSRAIFPEFRFSSWIHAVMFSLVYSGGIWVIFFVVALNMPNNFGLKTWLMGIAFLILQLALLAGLGLRLMRWFRLLKPASERLRSIVAETSAKMAVPVRAVWESTNPAANAVALVVTRELLFTQKLLATAPDDEIKAICAHELGHLNETRWVLAARILGTLSFFPFIFSRPIYVQQGPGGLAALAFFILLIRSRFLRKKLAHRMEKQADEIAMASVEGAPIYARALERLYQINQMPAIMRGKNIHPDLWDRMVSAGVSPDYSRPQPPAAMSWTSTVLIVTGVLLAGTIITGPEIPALRQFHDIFP